MSHLQIAMFIIGGVLVLAGLAGLLPVMLRHHDVDPEVEHMPEAALVRLDQALHSAELTPADAAFGYQPAYAMPELTPAAPLSANQTPYESPAEPPVSPDAPLNPVDFDTELVQELFAEMFSLRLAVDGLTAEVLALRPAPAPADLPYDGHSYEAA